MAANPDDLRPLRRFAAGKPKIGPVGGRAPLEMLGRTGLLELAGRVYDEWDTQLQGPRGRRSFREMADQDSTVSAMLFAFKMLVRQVHWSIEAADESPEAQANATFVEECLHDMDTSWPLLLSEICSCFTYGWSLFELNYKIRDGEDVDNPVWSSQYDDRKIGWRSWAIRSQESLTQWEFGDQNEVLGMWQMPPPDYRTRFIPMTKAINFRHDSRRGNPEGVSLLRGAYRDYYFKKNIETVEAIGAERNLVGFPVLYAPGSVCSPGAGDPEDQAASDAYLKLLENIRVDEQAGAMLPSDRDLSGNKLYELELLKSPGPALLQTDTIIARKQTGILQAVLADWLQLGHGARGSQALAQSKIEVFNTSLMAVLDSFSDEINITAIPRLCAINGMSTKRPRIVHGEVARTDLLALGTFINFLTQSGAQLDLTAGSPLLTYLLQEATLPGASLTDMLSGVAGGVNMDPNDSTGSPPDGAPTPAQQNYANRPRPASKPEPGNSTTLTTPPKPGGRPRRARNNL